MDMQESKTIKLETPNPAIKVEPEFDFGEDNAASGGENNTQQADAKLETDSGVEILRKQLEEKQKQAEEERKARIEAENLARQKEYEAKNAVVYAQDNQVIAFDNAIASLERDGEMLESQYAAALEKGDYAAAGKIQRQMSKLETRLEFVNKAKLELEDKLEQHKQSLTPPERQEYVSPQEQVEQYIKTLSPTAQNWIRQHPEVVLDPNIRNNLVRAHEEAVQSYRYAPDTPEYYAHIEAKMGYGGAQMEEPRAQTVPQVPRQQQRQPMASAPVTRSAGPSITRSNGSLSVTLSPAHREAAEIAGMTEEEYAAEMVRLANLGKISL